MTITLNFKLSLVDNVTNKRNEADIFNRIAVLLGKPSRKMMC